MHDDIMLALPSFNYSHTRVRVNFFLFIVRYICEQQLERRKDWRIVACTLQFQEVLRDVTILTTPERVRAQAAGLVPLFPRHVVFVVHLPPGVGQRQVCVCVCVCVCVYGLQRVVYTCFHGSV